MAATADVFTPSLAYQRMASRWRLYDMLLGGTLKMRTEATTWVPKMPAEQTSDYEFRIQNTFLFEAYKDTLRRIASKPFAEGITLRGTLPEGLDGLERNVDLRGNSLTKFAHAMFRDAVAYGLSHILVDTPAFNRDLTASEEARLGMRPYFCHIRAKDAIEVSYVQDTLGRPRVGRVRVKGVKHVAEGDWGSQAIEWVRVYKLRLLEGADSEVTWEEWQRNADREAHRTREPQVLAGTRDIPLHTLNLEALGPEEAESPLDGLAHVNHAHLISSSDQRNIVHVARVPILFRRGFTAKELKAKVTVGVSAGIGVESTEADMKFVEHTGNAIEAGRKELDDLKAEMEILGMQAIAANSGRVTATGLAIDEGKQQASIHSWVRGLEITLRNAYVTAAGTVGTIASDVDRDFDVDVFDDFALAMTADKDIDTILSMADRTRPMITRKTALEEVKRRGRLSATLDVQQEIADADEEAPAMFAPMEESADVDSQDTGDEDEQAKGQEPAP